MGLERHYPAPPFFQNIIWACEQLTKVSSPSRDEINYLRTHAGYTRH